MPYVVTPRSGSHCAMPCSYMYATAIAADPTTAVVMGQEPVSCAALISYQECTAFSSWCGMLDQPDAMERATALRADGCAPTAPRSARETGAVDVVVGAA